MTDGGQGLVPRPGKSWQIYYYEEGGGMPARFTIGIEEEFQLVDRQSGELAPAFHRLLEKGRPVFGEKLKPEIQQVVAELVSDIYPDMAAARVETPRMRAQLAAIAHEQGLALLSAGTHPGACWQEEMGAGYERYADLARELRELRRSTLIFGLHIHIGIEDSEMAIVLMNQIRAWLPQMLALSANSPFWAGRFTGMRSYRAVAWKGFPRSGVPEQFASRRDYNASVQLLIASGCIDNARSIWWDIRPHPIFATLEFRVFDMPATVGDTLALAALCQALVVKLAWLYRHNLRAPIIPRHLVEENKWHAMRDGLDAGIVDFARNRRLCMRDAIGEMLDFVDDVLDDLGSRQEMETLRALLDDPRGTGADRQVAVYQQAGSVEAVTRMLMEQTLEGVPVAVDTICQMVKPVEVNHRSNS
jgi:glutamate---cysteine ligase / carboxylate-amine ligase